MSGFEPRIVGFLCNWCAYAGADLAGISRIRYPPTIRIVRVMCSGRVDPTIILETFLGGVDGVLVMGCHPGDCHYMEGNYHAERRVKMLRKMLAKTGLELGRLRLEWVSASEGGRFAELIKEFTGQLKGLGPSPLAREKPDLSLLTDILAAKRATADFRLRLLAGREKVMVEEGNVYGEEVSQEEFNKILEEVIDAEYIRNKIYFLAKEKPLSVKELSERLKLAPQTVLRHIVMMRRRGWVAVEKVEGTTPFYRALEMLK